MSIKHHARAALFLLRFSLLAGGIVLPGISYAAQAVTAPSWAQAGEQGLRDGLGAMPLAWHRVGSLVQAAVQRLCTDSPQTQHELRAQALAFISSECVNDAFLIVFGAILLVMLFDMRSRMRAWRTAKQPERAARLPPATANAPCDPSQACEESADGTRT